MALFLFLFLILILFPILILILALNFFWHIEMDEANSGDLPGDSILQRSNSRNTIRTLAIESAMRMPDESVTYLGVKGIYNIVKILVCYRILNHQIEELEKPLKTFVMLLIIVDSMILFRYLVRLVGFCTEFSDFVKTLMKLVESASIM